ncbi:hypothetical protein IC608_03485 [Devosia sp. PTR5]|uniref:PepSY domain-containing protein n=1 Tax=Devosia oryzisoli TaxID=2774138 RepID=A0A927IRL2_9HYPH|nr:hypothetical protein [Devosia oryzisoli]MBD8064534.1 hypothetical protein [Devosia oryzisoli]
MAPIYKMVTVLLIGLGTFAPLQAASAQSMNFGIHFGDEPDDFFPPLPICLTDRQIRDAIADRGFSDIFLNVANEGQIQVRATRGNWVYLIDFDYCRDRIDDITRLRPAR